MEDSQVNNCILKNIDKIVELYFKGYSVKEAIKIIKKEPFAEGPKFK